MEPSPADRRSPTESRHAAQPTDPGLLLKFCELCVRAGQGERARQRLTASTLTLANWNASQLLRLIRVAEKVGAFDLAARALEVAVSRDRIPLALANHILQLAHTSDNPQLADTVRDWLTAKLPENERTRFQIQSLALISGPETAVQRTRAEHLAARTPKEAEAKANLLLQAGRRNLLLRYLACCRHRWPQQFSFVRLQALALSRFGEPESALSMVREASATCQGLESTRVEVQILLESGRLQAAQRLVDAAGEAGSTLLGPQQRIRLMLARGEFENAAALVPTVSSSLGRSNRSKAQFRITLVGAMLNEAQLFTKAASKSKGQWSTQAYPPGFEQAFFFPAKKALDAWQQSHRQAPQPVADSDIPCRILQYWDTDRIPADVEAVMNSWRQLPGYTYHCFNRRTAVAFLRRHFDAAHVQAFRLAHHVAEECDFLRLCLLLAKGGIYADADDKLIGDPDELRSLGRGAVLFREQFGAITNHLLMARPGHRLFQLAVDMARASLLARENDNTWSKTGPGLMTRATAVYLQEAMKAGPQLTMLPRYVSQRHVQSHVRLPYKTTPAYWNSPDGALPPALEAVITAHAAAKAAPSPS